MGRSSKDKGKRYERSIAALLTEISGREWARTKNSGRTDVPGDVYPVDDPSYPIVVECKNRVSWSMKDRVKNNAAYAKNLKEVLTTANLLDSRFMWLNVLCKDEAGTWLARWELGRDHAPCHVTWEHDFYDSPILVGGDGVEWLLIGTTTEMKEGFYERFFVV